MIIVSAMVPGLWFGEVRAVSQPQAATVIVLDPGHGWKGDPGALRDDLVEKTINLDVALQAEEMLERCGLDVRLTRTGDDQEHDLAYAAQFANAQGAAAVVSIHANTSKDGKASGTESWYAPGVSTEEENVKLGRALTAAVASQMGIPDLGLKQDTQSRFGRLYIRDMTPPAAIIELAFMDNPDDADLLRSQRRYFARAVAKGALDYLGLDATCADATVWAADPPIVILFPGDSATVSLTITNDGVLPWQSTDGYALQNTGNPLGNAETVTISETVAAGQGMAQTLTLTAPNTPLVYLSKWQVQRNGKAVGAEGTVYVVVVPQEAKELKRDFERRVAEWREAGEKKIEALIEELKRDLVTYIEEQTRSLITTLCGGSIQSLTAGGLVAITLWQRKRPRHCQ